ncbi:hypothetical protein D3C72_1986590 [compost metagenome]
MPYGSSHGSRKPSTRFTRYGEVTISKPIAATAISASPAKMRRLMPPRNTMPMVMLITTISAPKSGSASNRKATTTIAIRIGRKPWLKLCSLAALRTV